MLNAVKNDFEFCFVVVVVVVVVIVVVGQFRAKARNINKSFFIL